MTDFVGRRFGWHSGSLYCKDAELKGDLKIQDDIIFSDVSAGVLGVTGGIDMSSTTSATGIDMGGTHSTQAILIDGTSAIGIKFSGANVTLPIDCSGITSANASMWTLFNGTISGSSAIKGIYLEITSSKTSSSTEGIRAEAIGNAASGTQTIRGGYFKGNVNASKTVNQVMGVYSQVSYAEGSVTATDVIGLGVHVSQGASLTATGSVYGAKIHLQTRGDETISGDHVALLLHNEAVGGNGAKLDAAIKVTEASLSGGIHMCDYLIDCGTNTDIIDTALLRVGDDQTICSDDNQAILVDISETANAGFLKVIVGTSTKYIALYDTKTS